MARKISGVRATPDRAVATVAVTVGAGAEGVPIELADLDQWVAELPLTAPHTSLRRVRRALAQLVAEGIETGRLLDILDRYRGVTTRLLEGPLRRFFLVHALPIPRQNQDALQACSELCFTLGVDYLERLTAIDPAEGVDSEDLRRLALRAAEGAIASFAQAMRCAYGCYRTLPRDIWRHVHESYERARAMDLVDPQTDGSGTVLLSLEREYRRVLVLGLCNPYQLPFGAVNELYELLGSWADKTSLRANPDDNPAPCQFLVDPHTDKAAIPLLPHYSRNPDIGGSLILDVGVLVDTLKLELQRLTSQDSVADHEALSEFSDFERIEILRTLVAHLGELPIRRHERVAGNQRCRLVVGLSSAHYVANGFKSGLLPAGPQARLRQFNISRDWRVRDESATGIRLSKFSVNDITLAVGDVIAFDLSDGEDDWIAGIVRWTRTGDGKSLELGVYKLGGDFIPARLITESPDTPATQQPVIYLPEFDPLKRRPSVLASPGLYRPQTPLTVQIDDTVLRLKATHLIASSRTFEWFEVADHTPL